MSTTDDIWTAYEYSGGWDAPASILEISYDGASRGASISSLSVFPREVRALKTLTLWVASAGFHPADSFKVDLL